MKVMYDSRYHLHLGYYKNGLDIESIALKRQSEEVWDVFFDFIQYRLHAPEDECLLEGYGTLIFSVYTKDLSFESGSERFEKWLTSQKIVEGDDV